MKLNLEGALSGAQFVDPTADRSAEGMVWCVVRETSDHNTYFGHARFKTLDCAARGVNPLEAGKVAGFALVDANDKAESYAWLDTPLSIKDWLAPGKHLGKYSQESGSCNS